MNTKFLVATTFLVYVSSAAISIATGAPQSFKTPKDSKTGRAPDYITAELIRDCTSSGKEFFADLFCKRQDLVISTRGGDAGSRKLNWNSAGVSKTADGFFNFNISVVNVYLVPDGGGASDMFYYFELTSPKNDDQGRGQSKFGMVLDASMKVVIPPERTGKTATWIQKMNKKAKTYGEIVQVDTLIDTER